MLLRLVAAETSRRLRQRDLANRCSLGVDLATLSPRHDLVLVIDRIKLNATQF